MRAHEVIMGVMQRHRRPEIRRFLAESFGQPHESAAFHPDAQILALHIGRGRIGQIQIRTLPSTEPAGSGRVPIANRPLIPLRPASK